MKRALFATVKVTPFDPATAFDRDACLSAVLGVKCTAATGSPTLSVKLQHCADSGGTYTDVPDTLAVMSKALPLANGGTLQINLDLVGCLRYIKVVPTITGTATVSYALALGDAPKAPIT